jgi:L-fucose mutarotase
MLKGPILHPQILHALGRSGHGSKVLISDGNFPHWTAKGPNAEFVALNLAPGVLGVTDVLKVLAAAIPIEAATVMAPNKSGPYTLPADPPIWEEFRKVLARLGADTSIELAPIERFAFYDAAAARDVCLTIATGEQQIYANLLLTIGVVR